MKQSLWWTIVIALILAGCPLPNAPASGAGLVRLMLGSGNGRTLMPETPAFAKYDFLFTPTAGPATDTVTMNDVLAEEYIDVELLAGTWTVAVTGYTAYDLNGDGNDEYYKTATGVGKVTGTENTAIEVIDGGIVDVTVTLTPVAPGTSGAPPGIFSYNITFPEGVTGAITLTPVVTGTAPVIPALTSSPAEGSLEVAAGYYDMVIQITRTSNGTMGGVYSAVHIYPGMKTRAEYTLTDADLVSAVNLAGTVSNGGLGMTVKAYSDAARTTLFVGATASVAANGGWLLSFSFDPSNTTAYFTISDGATTLNAGDTGSTAIPANGRSGITLWFPCFYVSQGGDDTNGTGSKGNPFGSVQKAVNAVNTAYTSGNWPSGESALINISGEALTSTTGGTDGLVVINGGSAVYPPITLKGYNNGTYPTHSINATGLSKRVLYINNGANVTMDNLTLTGGNVSATGGGVAVYGTDSAFTMLSGTISGNTATGTGGTDGGGGVYVSVSGTGEFSMSGGTISGNTATNNGGGVYYNNGTFTMSGGTIGGATDAARNTALKGGGVYVATSAFTMSGSAVIAQNNDVYLPNTKQVTINGTLTPSGSEYAAKLTPQTYPTTATPLVNALTGGTEAQLKAAALRFTVTNSGTINYAVSSLGKIGYAVASRAVATDALTGIAVTPYYVMLQDAVDASTGSAGSPDTTTLIADIDSSAKMGANSITVGSGRYIKLIPGGGTRTIKRWSGNNGSLISLSASATSLTLAGSGSNELIIDGGAVWNGTDPETRSNTGLTTTTASLITVSSGTTIMQDGAVLQNNGMTGQGGAVTAGGTFKMQGGKIINNTCSGYGGAIYYSGSGNFTMSGTSVIDGNRSNGGFGGAIMMQSSGATFNLEGGTIGGTTGNSAGAGGAIYLMGGGTINMTGGAISNNKASGTGGVYVNDGTFNMSAGTISGNIFTNGSGGGVNVYTNGIFNMSGSAVVNQNNPVFIDASDKFITIKGALNPEGGISAIIKLFDNNYTANRVVLQGSSSPAYTMTAADADKFTLADVTKSIAYNATAPGTGTIAP
jgi:hypothetical protein